MMSRDIPDTLRDILDDDVVFPFFAVELNFDGTIIRLWTGPTTINIDSIEYLGTGSLLNVSAVEEGTDMSVKTATLTLEGVSGELISLALQTPYQGRDATILFGCIGSFQEEGYLLTENVSNSFLLLEDGGQIELEGGVFVANLFEGYMDQMQVSENISNPTISLNIVNKMIDLERQRTARYNSGYHNTRYPNDLGFEYVESLQEQETVWGATRG